jgi:hypothetical protein
LAINITSAGSPGLHSFRKVNVNSEDNYIYFKEGNIPIEIVNGSTYIYSNASGSIQGLESGSLVYIQIETDQVLKFQNNLEEDLDFSGSSQ